MKINLYNLSNNKDALRVLAEEGGWFKDKWESIAKEEDFSFNDTNNENIDNNDIDINIDANNDTNIDSVRSCNLYNIFQNIIYRK